MNIVIVGLGVIGGSYAKGLKNAGYENVFGVDKDESTLKKAEKLRIISQGSTDEKVFLKNADIVIIALYPRQVTDFIKNNSFKDGCIITDVTGIKTPVINDVLKILPENIDFVFAHPMAGREKKGIEYSDAGVFVGANFLITPTERNKEADIALIEKLARDIGFKNIRRIAPEIHDEMIGYTSQLPHALAVALMNSDNHNEDTAGFIGDSYRDLTRIAKINKDLWSELFLENKKNLLKSISDFEKQLDLIKDAVEKDDSDALCEMFSKSTLRREKIDKG